MKHPSAAKSFIAILMAATFALVACSDVGDSSSFSAPEGGDDGTLVSPDGAIDDSSSPTEDGGPSVDGSPDTGSGAIGHPVEAGGDTGYDSSATTSADSGVADAGAADTGVPPGMDSGVNDSGATGAGDADARAAETGAPDSGADAGPPDSGTADAAETGTPDTGTPDTGAADSGLHDSGAVDSGTPDTGVADTGADGGASPCAAYNNGGPCTATEQKFVNKSVDCYQCLAGADCIDTAPDGVVGAECDDGLKGNAAGGAKAGTSKSVLCLSLLDCVIATSCASTDISGCYCGSLGFGSNCATATGTPNGPCVQQEVDAAEHLITDPVSVVFKDLTDTTRASGVIAAIFSCAKGNQCTSCSM